MAECIVCGTDINIHDEVYDGRCSDCRKKGRKMKEKSKKSHMEIHTKDGSSFRFIGWYLGQCRPDGKETKNWHYYKDTNGKIYHFRKEHMVAVVETNVE